MAEPALAEPGGAGAWAPVQRRLAAALPTPVAREADGSAPPVGARALGLGAPVSRSASPPAPEADEGDVPWADPPAPAPVQRSAADPAAVALAEGLGRRQADGAVVFAPPPQAVQRQTETAAPTPAAATTVEPTAAAPAAPDLNALTDQLYDRIARRLRADLLFDRERKGVLADTG
jgi:hypothetical protein